MLHYECLNHFSSNCSVLVLGFSHATREMYLVSVGAAEPAVPLTPLHSFSWRFVFTLSLHIFNVLVCRTQDQHYEGLILPHTFTEFNIFFIWGKHWAVMKMLAGNNHSIKYFNLSMKNVSSDHEQLWPWKVLLSFCMRGRCQVLEFPKYGHAFQFYV